MESNEIDSWLGQPDVCRCCLSSQGEWDLTISYINEEGKYEVFSDMFRECYGMSLEHTFDWNISHMVCSFCVGRLRNAQCFRSQVVKAQERLLQFCSRQANNQPDIRLDVDRMPFSDNILPSNVDENSDTNHLDFNSNSPEDADGIFIREIEKRTGGREKNICNNVSKNPGDESANEDKIDTPSYIADERIVKKPKQTVGDVDIETDDYQVCNIRQDTEEKPVKTIKLISERKRLQLTCDVVLHHTTACPFRHRKSWFQCFFCRQEFMTIHELRTHTTSLHTNITDELRQNKHYPKTLQIDISELECKICALKLNSVDVMTCHFKEVHRKEIFKDCIADFKVNCSPYKCHLCEQTFHVFRSLTIHLNEHYANCICDVCGKSFLNSKRLKVHKRTHDIGDYPCSECGKVLTTKTSHINHMQSAHSKRVLKCQVCQLPMKHYNERVKHMSEVHNITHTFKCTICPREYNIKHYLATHMRQTHGHKDKKCAECEMLFITNHGLKKHMLKHSGEKPHLCRVCNKSYARRYTLKEHMRAHEPQST